MRRVGIAAPDLRDVAEAEHAPADDEVDAQHVLLGPERARDPQRQRLVAGLDRSGRLDHILCLQRAEQGRAVDAEAGELLHRELDEDLLVLGAQNFDLGDVRHLQELGTDALDVVAQLPMGEAIGGEAVDDPEGIAEVVIETRPDDTGGQGMADIADALAHVIPDVGNLLGRGAAFEIDEDGRDARAREAAQEVELRRFLQLALEPLGDLLERVLDRGARPCGLHDHGLDDEGRILVATEPVVGQHAGDHRDDHEVDGQRAVAERPFRKIEGGHGSDPSRRTF